MSNAAVELPPSVTLAPARGGLPALSIRSALCDAEVYLHGAHVTRWTPAGERPVIWLSQRAVYQPGSAIRGGIPLCAPWFGGGPTGDRTPAHGWFRLTEWTLLGVGDDRGAVTVRLAASGPEVSATYELRFSETLALSLTVRAGNEAVEFEDAFHAYFAVSDVRDIRIDGLAGRTYSDKTAGGRLATQSGPVTFDRETDRVYAHEGPATIVDPGLSRRVTVTKQGSLTTVVWNPWIAKAAAMGDFGDHEWPGMVCVETANAMGEAIHLTPGAEHTMTATISVAQG
jgi:glucose-6-phosphate 1-epimerase